MYLNVFVVRCPIIALYKNDNYYDYSLGHLIPLLLGCQPESLLESHDKLHQFAKMFWSIKLLLHMDLL